MNASEWNEQAAREKAIGDTSLPSRKYVSKLQVEIARGKVIERELAFCQGNTTQ